MVVKKEVKRGMAQSISKQVEDMSDAMVPVGTMQYLTVLDPVGYIASSNAWISFDADNAAWRIANPGEPDPTEVPFAAAVDPDSPTLMERLFVQTRFMVTHSDNPSRPVREPAQWSQVNATNFPTLNIAAYATAAGNIYDAQRVFAGLVPV